MNFADQNPLGRHLILWKDRDQKTLARDMEIVGISKDARYGDLKREIRPPSFTSRMIKAIRSRTR